MKHPGYIDFIDDSNSAHGIRAILVFLAATDLDRSIERKTRRKREQKHNH